MRRRPGRGKDSATRAPAAASDESLHESVQPATARSIDSAVGQLFVHAADRVMTPALEADGTWEPAECAWLTGALRAGDTFLDVGANIGFMSLLAGKIVGAGGRVICIEPEARNLELLRANLRRNGVRAEVHALAAHTAASFLPLVVNEENRGDHRVLEGASADIQVPCARLDEILAGERIDVAKIDTQGADHLAIEGMRGLFERNPAVRLLSEFWLAGLEQRDIDPRAVLGFYRKLGFGVSVLSDRGRPEPASDDAVIAACESWAGRYVNLVLERA